MSITTVVIATMMSFLHARSNNSGQTCTAWTAHDDGRVSRIPMMRHKRSPESMDVADTLIRRTYATTITSSFFRSSSLTLLKADGFRE